MWKEHKKLPNIKDSEIEQKFNKWYQKIDKTQPISLLSIFSAGYNAKEERIAKPEKEIEFAFRKDGKIFFARIGQEIRNFGEHKVFEEMIDYAKQKDATLYIKYQE